MNVRDSAGRSVSLLNDEPTSPKNHSTVGYPSPNYSSPFNLIQSHAIRSQTASPATPALTRADSCDTPQSPQTPLSSYDVSYRISAYSLATASKEGSPMDYHTTATTAMTAVVNAPTITTPKMTTSTIIPGKRLKYTKFSPSGPSPVRLHHPSTYEMRESNMEPHVYDEDSYFDTPIPTERVPKRYPCRYRDSHHCLKTFTTSGHASRHSKIHTAEKGVSCTWEGCHKKFTRSDNMKQHLETHTKERSRGSRPSAHNSLVSSDTSRPQNKNILTMPAGVKKLTNYRSTCRNGSEGLLISSSLPSTPPDLTSSTALSTPSSIAHHSIKIRGRPHSSSAPSDMSSLLDPAMIKRLQFIVSSVPGHSNSSFPTNHGLDAMAIAAVTQH